MTGSEAAERILALVPLDEGAGSEPVERVLRRALRRDPAHVEKLLRQRRVLIERRGEPPVALERRAMVRGPGRLVVLKAPPRPPPQKNTRIRLRALLEEPSYAVLDKPASLPMHPGPRHGSDTLLNALVARYPELLALGRERGFGLVHRLDIGTSGVVLVARTAAAYDHFVEEFKERRVGKRYIAIADERAGRVREGTFTGDVAGAEAATVFRVLSRREGVALVEAMPISGRTHQIRVHLAAQGAPVLADARHGRGLDELTGALYLKRLALHAERLSFRDPESGERVEVSRDLPRDLRRAWKRARELARLPGIDEPRRG